VGVLDSAFHDSWFSPIGALGHQVRGDDPQQFLPERPALFAVRRLRHGDLEVADSIHGSFETDASQLHALLSRRLPHDPAQEIVGNEKGQQLLLHHGGGPTTPRGHAERGFQIIQTEFERPALPIGLQNLLRWIRIGI